MLQDGSRFLVQGPGVSWARSAPFAYGQAMGQLNDPRIHGVPSAQPTRIRRDADAAQVEPSRLRIEITEVALLDDARALIKKNGG